ncbi:helix-turn-helix transcriptional regulator [Pseudochryseolinea flava]|nr:WYL domain-containing protein [Pseudochryseolinea flava]
MAKAAKTKPKAKAKAKTVKATDDAFIPQTKLLRLFQIIAVLKSGHWTIQQLADRFDTSKRTMYRYMKILEQVEFLVETDFNNRYFIVTSDDDPIQAQFTLDEMSLIKKLIKSAATDTPIKNSLLRKLSLNSELDSVPQLFVKARLSKIVEQVSEAIRGKKQIVLKNYHSANSNEIRDRLVEPIHFGDNYQSVMALDTQDKVCKQFKLDRIGDIVEMNKSYAFENLHKKTQTDIFGYTGDADTWITLRMTMRAYLLLREEYPLAIPYLEKREDHYQFHAPVVSFEGAGRFTMGLIDEIKVEGPDDFKTFIHDRVTKYVG